MSSNKQTPKSCSCRSCKRGKRSETGKFLTKKEERAFRHSMNRKANINDDVCIAPFGSYKD